MAGQHHVIDVPGELAPWPLAFEVATATPRGSWTLVGGLMVHVHAIRAGIESTRPTRDVDVLLNIDVVRVTDVGESLLRLGFETAPPLGREPVHRFRRDRDVIDVMVARDVRVGTRWRARPILRSPGAAQALRRRDVFALQSGTSRVEIDVPDALGAMIAKAAAYAIDSRNPGRHLEDLAVLAAAAGPVRELGLDGLTRKDRRHLSRVVPLLADGRHPAWAVLDRLDQALGQRVWNALEEACPPGGSRRRVR